jgi:hypothetical protein
VSDGRGRARVVYARSSYLMCVRGSARTAWRVCGVGLVELVSVNAIGGAGAAAIAEALIVNTTITSVELAGWCRAPAGPRACLWSFMCIAVRWNLCLGLADNGIGGAGAAAIAEALKLNTSITRMDMLGE